MAIYLQHFPRPSSPIPTRAPLKASAGFDLQCQSPACLPLAQISVWSTACWRPLIPLTLLPCVLHHLALFVSFIILSSFPFIFFPLFPLPSLFGPYAPQLSLQKTIWQFLIYSNRVPSLPCARGLRDELARIVSLICAAIKHDSGSISIVSYLSSLYFFPINGYFPLPLDFR